MESDQDYKALKEAYIDYARYMRKLQEEKDRIKKFNDSCTEEFNLIEK